MNSRAITIQFIGGEDISSSLIGWFSSGHLSHVDAVMPNGSLLGSRTDRRAGVPPGVQMRPANYYGKAKSVVRFWIPCSEREYESFYVFLQRQINKPYDYEAVWGFLFGRDWHETDSWICSELIAAALEKSGIVPSLYLAANKITPVALALAISVLHEPQSVQPQAAAGSNRA